MALLIAVGVICQKTKIIGNEVNKGISDIALKVSTPALLVSSFQQELNAERLQRLGYAALLAVIAILFAAVLGYLCIPKVRNRSKDDNGRLSIERFSAIYSNCAFMGIPLINGIYGDEGVFYLTAFYALFNIAVWTHGVIMMKGETGVRQVLKALASPALIGIVIGAALFFLQISLPDVIKQALDYAGSMTTPLGMLVAGVTIAQTNLPGALKKLKIYYISALRLIIIPVLTIVLFLLFPFDETVMGVTVAAAACPAATICTMFAISFNKDSLYAGEIFAVSTVLSAVSLPLIMWLFDFFNGFIR
ncbi:MAG: AEC family transporter [Ruminococcaceae bacterium]|nr:AEC family transporter [Oscillospiraceae bacterium]